MSKGNKFKAKGTREQRRQRELLQARGYKVETLAEGGIYDLGDLRISIGMWDLIVECKDSAALNIHDTVVNANRKAAASPSNAVVWWKRTKKVPGNKIRTQVGKPIVCMNEDLFIELLGYARTIWNRGDWNNDPGKMDNQDSDQGVRNHGTGGDRREHHGQGIASER